VSVPPDSFAIESEQTCSPSPCPQVTVLEYQRLTYDHPQITTVTVAAARANSGALANTFDVAVSASSFDHDGLGRYGDPLCPDGDLLAMDEVRALPMTTVLRTGL